MRTDLIKVRVFIEGVQIPRVSTVSVQTFDNETSEASITLPVVPGFETEELKRARVHIYWSNIEVREKQGDDWPLLFEGEIVADSFGKSVNSRQQTFYCAGYYTYWQQVLLYFYDTSSAPTNMAYWANSLSLSIGNKEIKWESGVAGGNLTQRLVNEVKKHNDVPYHSMVKSVFTECLNANRFFEYANEQLKLSNRFASAKDDNLDILVGYEMLKQFLENDILKIGGEASMMQVLKSLLSVFRYQIINNAQPVLANTKSPGKTITPDEIREDTLDTLVDSGMKRDTVKIYLDKIDTSSTKDEIENTAKALLKSVDRQDDEEAQRGLYALLITFQQQLDFISNAFLNDKQRGMDIYGDELVTQFLLLPETRFAAIPTCNIIFPQDQTSLSMNRQLLREPTRIIGRPTQFADAQFRIYMSPSILQNAIIPDYIIPPKSIKGYSLPLQQPFRVTSPYGIRSIPKHKRDKKVNNPNLTEPHEGIDLGRGAGVTPEQFKTFKVFSIDDGVVFKAGYQNEDNHGEGYGKRVFISHGSITTIYAHLSEIYVSVGQKVTSGQIIGQAGTTGSSNGLHLHFEVRKGGGDIDPTAYTIERKVPEKTEDPEPVTIEGKKITDAKTDQEFRDFVYLTPEEQKTGIVPYFDYNVVRAHATTVRNGNSKQIHDHYRNMLEVEYLAQKYGTRSINVLNMPFNPYVIAGFQTLVVDRVRSIIGLVSSVSHIISVGGGQGTASTTVQITSPRFWDEGDPYYWKNGKSTTDINDQGKVIPKAGYGNFPTYYLQSLVDTNSSNSNKWWDPTTQTIKRKWRPTDSLYQALLGPNVRAIDYQFASRTTTSSHEAVFNAAIDSRPLKKGEQKPPNKNTIVCRYYELAKHDSFMAENYVKNLTKRLGAKESEIMITTLGSVTTDGGITYTGPAFRKEYQDLVQSMNTQLELNLTFKG